MITCRFRNDPVAAPKLSVPQKALSSAIRQQLDLEVAQLTDLCDLLELLHTAKEFLASIGGDPNEAIAPWMTKLRLVPRYWLNYNANATFVFACFSGPKYGKLRQVWVSRETKWGNYSSALRLKRINAERRPFDAEAYC